MSIGLLHIRLFEQIENKASNKSCIWNDRHRTSHIYTYVVLRYRIMRIFVAKQSVRIEIPKSFSWSVARLGANLFYMKFESQNPIITYRTSNMIAICAPCNDNDRIQIASTYDSSIKCACMKVMQMRIQNRSVYQPMCHVLCRNHYGNRETKRSMMMVL